MANSEALSAASAHDETQGEPDFEDLQRLFFSRLDEQQRRWYAALEALRLGHGGNVQAAELTGLSVRTIRRGRRELQAGFQGRAPDRVRLAGGGRPRVEKKA